MLHTQLFCGGGWAEELVLLERLEGESVEEPHGAVAGAMVGAVVNELGDEEDGDAGDRGGQRRELGRALSRVGFGCTGGRCGRSTRTSTAPVPGPGPGPARGG